jgi:serine/threonine protein phosphatase 1
VDNRQEHARTLEDLDHPVHGFDYSLVATARLAAMATTKYSKCVRRHIVIGDIHGCFAELQDLLAAVRATDDDMIVSVGDLVDRGPESVEVLQFFRERPQSRVAICGNHERKHVRGVFSYGQEITKLQFGASYDEAVVWMRTLPYYLELDDAIVVHAGLVPGVPLTQQSEDVLCGSTSGEKKLVDATGRWWHERYVGEKPIIFGHHVVERPLLRDGRIYGIDTGACHGQRLTAITLPGFQLHSVPARADHWTQIKRQWQADVLGAKDWAGMMWSELDEQMARFATNGDARTTDFIAQLRAWRASVEMRVDEVHAAIVQLAASFAVESRNEQAQRHPLSKYLFQAFRDRLDRAALLKQLHTPCGLDDLAAILTMPRLIVPVPARRELLA